MDVTLREFTAAEGAEAHCRVSNFRPAHLVIFGWLGRVFDLDPDRLDTRLLC